MITEKTALANALLVAYQTKSSPDELIQALTTALAILAEEKIQFSIAQKILEQAGDRPVPGSIRREAEKYQRVAQAVDHLTLLKISAEKAQHAADHATSAEGDQP